MVGSSSSFRVTAGPAARRTAGLFFVGLSFTFLALSIVGFAPSFFRGEPVPSVAIGHGVLMAAWLALFIAQTLLVATGKVALHRRLGTGSTALAAVIWISMAVATVAALKRFQPELDNYLYDVLMVQLGLMALFAVFFVWGYAARRRADAHKRLMALATLVLVQAALDRMGWQPLPGPMLVWILLIAFWLFDIVMLRRVHRVTLIGTALIVAVHLAVLALWGWPAWHRVVFDLVHGH